MIYLIQPAEVKAPVIAGFQRLGLGNAPLHKGVHLVFAAPRLVCRDAHIVERVFLFLEPVDLFVYQVRFELSRTPTDADPRPAVAVGRDA